MPRYLRFFLRMFRRTYHLMLHMPEILQFVKGPLKEKSFFPEEEQKSRMRIFLDNVIWFLRTTAVNKFYYEYGFDLKRCKNMDEYIEYKPFERLQTLSNNWYSIGKRRTEYRCLLRDKFVFQQVATCFGFPVPKAYAVFEGDRLFWSFMPAISCLEDLKNFENVDMFFKRTLGQEAEAIFVVRFSNNDLYLNRQRSEMNELRKRLQGIWLVQERVAQHPRMDELYPDSLNTLRLITINDHGTIRLFSSLLRVGAGKNLWDDYTIGGVSGAVNKETGVCDPVFFRRLDLGGRIRKHPDTGIAFEGFEVPFFKEAVQMVKDFHKILYGLHSIGWDVAIRVDGPVFIEGNDGWGIRASQLSEGGLKKSFLDSLPAHIKQ